MIAIVSGPGGVGKGTVVGRLVQMEPSLRLSRSWTTRQRRASEDEDAYVFVTREQFEAKAAAGGFLEWTEFPGTGHLYGTPLIDDASDATVILEIELDGAQQVRARYPDALLIFVVAPSPEVAAARLRGRGDDEESVSRRLAVGTDEERLGRSIADFVVVNDDVERAAREVAGILRRYATGG